MMIQCIIRPRCPLNPSICACKTVVRVDHVAFIAPTPAVKTTAVYEQFCAATPVINPGKWC